MTDTITDFPITKDVVLKTWGDWHRTINLFEDDKVTPKDTTGYGMELVIFSSANGEIYDTLSVGSGITNTPASGQFNIDIPKATIAAYEFSTAEYTIAFDDGSGNTTPLMSGTVTVRAV